MRKWFVIILLAAVVTVCISFSKESLRDIYSRPSSEWPKPLVDAGVQWTELAVLPASPVDLQNDSVKNVVELGKALFFDTRLSGSEKISCATCHKPELNWTDGIEKSLGHEGAINKRNSPTIQNSWFYKRLFWDGRSSSLQDQAFAPINSSSEMHSDMPDVMRKLRRINGYKELFKKAFDSDEINPDKMAEAIATFEKTIISSKSRFDQFLEGNKNALTEQELKGLHAFRTKTGCMNCHNGSMFTDNLFHRTNLSFGPVDNGLYNTTHKEEDRQKFKTPSLRDVMYTGPWMHDGSISDMLTIMELYRKGPPGSPLLKPFSSKEIEGLIAFLRAISSPAEPFIKPVIPD